MRLVWIAFSVAFLLFACSSKLDKDGFVQWVKNYENGLHIRKTYSEFVFDLQYAPQPYLSLISERPVGVSDSLQYYILRVALANDGNFMQYGVSNAAEQQQRLYYFSYLFQSDLTLEENDVRKPCVLFHFEQSSLAKDKVFILAFENSNTDAPDTKLVIDSPVFGSLPIKMTISKENIPAVKI